VGRVPAWRWLTFNTNRRVRVPVPNENDWRMTGAESEEENIIDIKYTTII